MKKIKALFESLMNAAIWGQRRAELIRPCCPAPPLYIQKKVHPKALIDDFRRQTEQTETESSSFQNDLFDDFNGLPSEDAKTEFYQHDALV